MSDLGDTPYDRGYVNMADLSVFASYHPGTCDWKDSLVMRPGYEGE